MKIVIAGGSGFIGHALLPLLQDQRHELVVLTRHPDQTLPAGRAAEWDGKQLGAWTAEVTDADAVINLAGASISERWTAEHKKRIVASRVDSTRLLIKAMRQPGVRARVLINGSAIGYYGNVPEGDLDESSPAGQGFLAETCRQWEAAAREAEEAGIRVVRIRTGIVLGEGGGALEKMLPPFQFFLGGPLGSGKQWFSWVHRDDVAGVIAFALQENGLSGAVNATAPQPVRMQAFCRELGRVLHRPSFFPVPGFVLKTLLGEMAEEMLLSGQKVLPRRAMEAGYRFQHPDLGEALSSILIPQSRREAP